MEEAPSASNRCPVVAAANIYVAANDGDALRIEAVAMQCRPSPAFGGKVGAEIERECLQKRLAPNDGVAVSAPKQADCAQSVEAKDGRTEIVQVHHHQMHAEWVEDDARSECKDARI